MLKNNFIIGIFVVNSLLWMSYVYYLRDQTSMLESELWNNIIFKERIPMLVMATIAYVLNIVLALYFYLYKYVNTMSLQIIFISYVTYYILQLLFIPLLQQYTHFNLMHMDKEATYYKLLLRILLIIVVLPMGILMIFGLKESKKIYKKNKILSIFIAICSIVPFLHVLINDAYRFGFFF